MLKNPLALISEIDGSGRIDRQPHAELLHAGHAGRRVTARRELVEPDAELVQQRGRQRPLPRSDDVLDAHARPSVGLR